MNPISNFEIIDYDYMLSYLKNSHKNINDRNSEFINMLNFFDEICPEIEINSR